MVVSFNPYFKLDVVDLSDDTQVNSGGNTNDQAYRPDQGKIYQIVGMYYSSTDPAGSTANDQRLSADFYDGTNVDPIFQIIANTGSNLLIQRHLFYASTETPSGSDMQQRMITGGYLWSSRDYYIRFRYTNNTDANKTGTRSLRIFTKIYNQHSGD